jgi:hypothetical protein
VSSSSESRMVISMGPPAEQATRVHLPARDDIPWQDIKLPPSPRHEESPVPGDFSSRGRYRKNQVPLWGYRETWDEKPGLMLKTASGGLSRNMGSGFEDSPKGYREK